MFTKVRVIVGIVLLVFWGLLISRVCYAQAPHDDTAQVQAAATAHTCLAPGDYYVVTPPAPRHDYAILGGAVGCDPNSRAVIHMVGDGGGKFWVGFAPRAGDAVQNIKLDTSALVNADPNGKDGQVEQTHAIRVYPGISNVTISNNEIVHPIGGDCVNQVGPVNAPFDNGLVIEGNRFSRCHRGAIQLSRGTVGVIVRGNQFLDSGFDIGSEGAGGFLPDGTVRQTIISALVEHNYFTSPRGKGFAVQAEWWIGAAFLNNVSDARPWELFGTDNVQLTDNVIISTVPNFEGLIVGDRGWHIASSNDYVQGATGSFAVRQLGRGRPSDLGDITVAGGVFKGDITLRGVTGAVIDDPVLTGSVQMPCGLNGAGACITPTTNVTVLP